MRVAVVYDAAADTPDASPDTVGVLKVVDAVAMALAELGHTALPVPVAPPFAAVVDHVADADLVFNLCEGLGGRADGEPRVAALLELTGIPVTGAPSETLALCRRKDRVNAILEASGLPIPPWMLCTDETLGVWRQYPAIVKPAGEDGSAGIDERSVVADEVELAQALSRRTGDMLVQAFVGGRELNVAIVGDVVLPVAEIEFAGAQRVVSYAAKWEPGSVADLATRPVCPARIPAALHDEAVNASSRAWSLLGGRGYCRVDLRTDEQGRLYLLEVNPNPDMVPGDGLSRQAAAAGWDYVTLVDRLIREAIL